MMMDDTPEDVWPLPTFTFSVQIPDLGTLSFQEVEGLEAETNVIEYRAGNSKVLSNLKMPGLVKRENVTLKKGIVVNDNHFWAWFKQIKLNTFTRHTVVISLLDQEAKPTMVWKLANAWPIKISGPALKSDGKEVAIETLVLAHEGLTIENG